jgi:hypothetical protein
MNISKDEMRFKDGCDETRIIQLSIFKIFFVLQYELSNTMQAAHLHTDGRKFVE